MRIRRGFTLIEVLVVLAIVVVLVAIMTPVLSRAKRSAQISSSVQKLKQLHLALAVYQNDHASGGSDWYGRGLAPVWYYWNERFGFAKRDILTPCGFDQTLFESGPNTMPGWVSYVAPFYDPVNNNPGMGDYLETYKENAVAFVDCYCNPPGTSMRDIPKLKRGIAVTLGGQLINRQRTGQGFLVQFYSDPPSN